MMTLRKKETNKENKSFERFEILSKNELNFIRGGDQPNTENDGSQ